jgi:DNA-binding transcriptional MerR regulator
VNTDPDNTALGLERLRGELRTGLAEIKGALQVLVLRSEQSEKTTAAHAEKLEKHEQRIDALEKEGAAAADHDPRLRQVEKKVWAIGGGCAVAVVAAEILIRLFMH